MSFRIGKPRNDGAYRNNFGSVLAARIRRGVAGAAVGSWATIIDFIWFDEAQRQKSGHAQRRGGKEDRILCEIAADKALGNGGDYKPGGGETIISPGPG